MELLRIQVRGKVARNLDAQKRPVCGNSDYTLHFDFDADWDGQEPKWARIVLDRKGLYVDRPIVDNVAELPPLYDVTSVSVGAYAGDIRTTTPARVEYLPCIVDGDNREALTPEERESIEAQVAKIGDGIRTVLETAQGKQDKIRAPGIIPGQIVRVKTIAEDGTITEWDAVNMPTIPADMATTGYVDGQIREAIGAVEAVADAILEVI